MYMTRRSIVGTTDSKRSADSRQLSAGVARIPLDVSASGPRVGEHGWFGNHVRDVLETEIASDDFPDLMDSAFRPPLVTAESPTQSAATEPAPPAEATKRPKAITSTSGWAVVTPETASGKSAESVAPGPSTPETNESTGQPGLHADRLNSEPDSNAGGTPHVPNRKFNMANNINQVLAQLQEIDGFIAAAIADSASGLTLGKVGGSATFNVELAAAANTEVVKAKLRAMKSLKLEDSIEDILITLGTQYHLIRPLRSRPEIFFYVSLDRRHANLGIARFNLADAEANLTI